MGRRLHLLLPEIVVCKQHLLNAVNHEPESGHDNRGGTLRLAAAQAMVKLANQLRASKILTPSIPTFRGTGSTIQFIVFAHYKPWLEFVMDLELLAEESDHKRAVVMAREVIADELVRRESRRQEEQE